MKRLLSYALCLILLALPVGCLFAPTAAAEAQEPEPVLLSGSGNASESVQVDFSPSRLTLSGNAAADIGDQYNNSFSVTSDMILSTFLSGALAVDVEAEGDWTLVIEPIREGAALPLVGTGMRISGVFELTGPTDVTFTADGSKLTEKTSHIWALVNYAPEGNNVARQDSVMAGSLSGPDKLSLSADFTLNAGGESTTALLAVYCLPEVEWSMRLKGTPLPIRYTGLSLRDKGQEVLAMKQRLYELGYFKTSKFNNIFNESTADAVKLFERNNDMPIDGVADEEMLRVLFSEFKIGK